VQRPPLDLSRTASVILDVDGTIAGPDHRISPRTRAAIRGLDQRGVPVVLATGRARDNVLDIARQTGLRSPAVSCNGAVVSEPQSGRDLRVQPMASDDVAAMLRVHAATGAPLTWFTPRGIFATSAELRELLLALGDPNVVVTEAPASIPDDVVKMMVYGTPAEMDAVEPVVRRHVPRATRSLDELWEVSDPDATKWSGISFVFDLLGLDPAGAVGLGDGENDVVWMERIGTPVAMGNARPEARAAALAVAGHYAEEGAAVFLEEVLRQVG
jgi:Cof subfamily protein (haloacid dehalogenase superfamily)